MSLDLTHLMAASVDEAKLPTPYGEVSIELREIAQLILPTGAVVACDPFLVADDDLSFERRISSGRYPVQLSIAHFPDDDQRVALATIHIAIARPVRCEMATIAGQDIAALKDDEFYGYGVDTGTGCFMDRLGAAALAAKMDVDAGYSDTIIKAMESRSVQTWDWADIVLDPMTGLNCVAFSSGLGDGTYGSFWGLDDAGNVCRLTTDFGFLYASAE